MRYFFWRVYLRMLTTKEEQSTNHNYYTVKLQQTYLIVSQFLTQNANMSFLLETWNIKTETTASQHMLKAMLHKWKLSSVIKRQHICYIIAYSKLRL